MGETETTRRAVLAGAAGLAAAGALAGCGDDTPAIPGDAGSVAGGNAAAGLAKKSDIPVGGGKIFKTEQVVITQPTAGTFKAFSAVCTHQGCTVSTVASGTIGCECHGSKFSATDGSVKGGPAKAPLPAKQVKIDGDGISVA